MPAFVGLPSFARKCSRVFIGALAFEQPVSKSQRLSFAVKELLAGGRCWTKDRIAEHSRGKCVPFNSPRAVKWSLYGAICRCYPNKLQREQVLATVREALGMSLAAFDRDPLTRWPSFAYIVDGVEWPTALPSGPTRRVPVTN